MILFSYGIVLCQTVFNTFNNFGQNIAQVISLNPKEKKTVATIRQLSYYIGHGEIGTDPGNESIQERMTFVVMNSQF